MSAPRTITIEVEGSVLDNMAEGEVPVVKKASNEESEWFVRCVCEFAPETFEVEGGV